MSIDSDIAKLTEGLAASRRESMAYAVRFNCRTWDALRREDPELTRLEIGIAWCARIMVTEAEDSPQYAEARAQDRRLRDQRYALWQRRAQTAFDSEAP